VPRVLKQAAVQAVIQPLAILCLMALPAIKHAQQQLSPQAVQLAKVIFFKISP